MNLRSKFLSSLAALALAIGGVLAGVQMQPQPQPPVPLGAGVQTLGGVIRLYDSGPEWHADADHYTSGIDPTIDPVIDSAGMLTFWTVEKNAVISCEASPDESLVKLGITVGCSNGSNLVRLQFVKVGTDGQPAPLDLNSPIHYSRVAGPYNNIWVEITHNTDWVAP